MAALDWYTVALAVVCYAGIVVNASVLSVPGRSGLGTSPHILFFYVGFFPLPRLSKAWLLQQLVLCLAMGAFGPGVLRFQLERWRAVRAYQAGRPAAPLHPAAGLLIYVPAMLVVARVLSFGDFTRSAWTDPGGAAVDLGAQLGFGFVAMLLLVSGYFGVAWLFGRGWLRALGPIPLLSAAWWFNWMNAVGAVLSVAMAVVIGAAGVDAVASRLALLGMLLFALISASIELRTTYDAVLRRVLTFHVLLAVAATIVVGGALVLPRLGLGVGLARALILVLLALAAIALPGRVDRTLERWLFPRAAALRARLAAITDGCVGAPGRGEAARALLVQAVDALDAEGGIAVLAATEFEPAEVSGTGRVEAAPLGATTAEAAAFAGALATRSGPLGFETLPLAEQVPLLRAGVVVVCPLAAGRREGTLFFAPRRGWLYDSATLEALRVLGTQAGLVLESLRLTAARVHGEKLAALGEAAARIAHEIRNPLTGARSLLQQARAMDGAGALVEPALGELDRIGRLVRDLLAFARSDGAGARRPVDLETVCRQALGQVTALASDHGVAVEAALVPATVAGDPDRLVQVVANLCRNAIEALGDTPGPRRLAVRSAAADGVGVVEVRDNGPGIAPDDLGRLFEPFRTTKSTGTGLGLSIARRIVEAHGGRLGVESVPGWETVFRVALPLANGTS